jgi:hypothetical protein
MTTEENMKTKSDEFSEFFLARWHTDDITDEERTRWEQDEEAKRDLNEALEERQALLDDEDVMAGLDALMAQGEDFLASLEAKATSSETSLTTEASITPELAPASTTPARPTQDTKPGWLAGWMQQVSFWSWGGMAAAAMAAMALFWWQPNKNNPTLSGHTPRVIHKRPSTAFGTSKGANQMGSWRIIYARKGQALSQFLRDGQRLFPGDHVQFAYTLSQSGLYAAIVSINQKGKMSAYAPFRGDQSVLLHNNKGTWPKSSSLILDDALGQEWLIIAMARKPFSIERLKQQMKEAYREYKQGKQKTLKVPGPWTIQLLSINKSKAPKATPDGR